MLMMMKNLVMMVILMMMIAMVIVVMEKVCWPWWQWYIHHAQCSPVTHFWVTHVSNVINCSVTSWNSVSRENIIFSRWKGFIQMMVWVCGDFTDTGSFSEAAVVNVHQAWELHPSNLLCTGNDNTTRRAAFDQCSSVSAPGEVFSDVYAQKPEAEHSLELVIPRPSKDDGLCCIKGQVVLWVEAHQVLHLCSEGWFFAA